MVPPALTILPGDATATVPMIRSVLASITSTAPDVLSDASNLAVGVAVGVGVGEATLNVAFPGEHPESRNVHIPQTNANPVVTSRLPHAPLVAIPLNINLNANPGQVV